MLALVVTLITLTAILLVLVVLAQNSKGGGLSSHTSLVLILNFFQPDFIGGWKSRTALPAFRQVVGAFSMPHAGETPPGH